MNLLWNERSGSPASGRTSELSLGRSETGAIMVLGVFLAVVLVGILYYLAGIGATVYYREYLQDASDAVSLGTAIGHARGMNLIVFLNLVMAALVAIVLALKIIELLLTGLILLLTAISWFFPPAGVAIPIITQARSFVSNVKDTAEDIVDELLVVLNTLEGVVKVITPAAAVGAAYGKTQAAYGNITTAAVAVPPRLTLPVEDDEYSVLCDQAGKILKGLISDSVGRVPLIGKVLETILGGLIDAVNSIFCKGEIADPSTEIEIDRTRPWDANGPSGKCEKDQSEMKQDTDNCDDWEEEREQRRPNTDGDCEGLGAASSVCAANLRNARVDCKYNASGRKNFSFSTVMMRETWEYDRSTNGWKSTEKLMLDEGRNDYPDHRGESTVQLVNTETAADAQGRLDVFGSDGAQVEELNQGQLEELEKQDGPVSTEVPCSRNIEDVTGFGSDALREDILDSGNEAYWSPWNANTSQPVCHQQHVAMARLPELPPDPDPSRGERPWDSEPLRALPDGFDPGPHTFDYKAIKHIYGCASKEKIKLTIPIDVDLDTVTQDKDDKVPQKVEEGLELGGNDFQIRGVAIGVEFPELYAKQLKVSAFHRDPGRESWVPLARTLGRVAISQAEYYYNHRGDEDRAEWMWNVKWRARLVRFRLPEDEDDEESGGDSGGGIAAGPGNVDLGTFGLEMPNLDFMDAVSQGMSSGLGNDDSSGVDLDVMSYLIVH